MKITKDRKEMAQAINFGKYPVLTYDLDAKEGAKAVVTKESSRYGTMRYKCQLFCGYVTEGDGMFYLMTLPTVLSSSVGVHDWIEAAEYANAPVIEANQEVAILIYSKKQNTSVVKIVKSGKVDPTYSTATRFNEIEEETTMSVTPKELSVLNVIKSTMDMYCDGFSDVMMEDIVGEVGLSVNVVKGLVGSLVSKGLVGAMDVNGEYNVYYLTDAGQKFMGVNYN